MMSKDEINELLIAWDNEHGHRIWGALRAKRVQWHDAQDAMQEARINVACHLSKGKPPGKDVGAWLVVITVRVWIDLFVRKPTPPTVDDTVLAFAADARATDPAEQVADREADRILAEVIDSLDRRLRRVVKSYRKLGNLREVADELRLPYGTVRYRLEQAAQLLKEILEARRDEFF